MKKTVLFIAALSLFVSSPLLAAQMQTFKSGNKLLSECSPLFSQNKSKIELLAEASCFSYIKGVFDLHQTLVARGKIEAQICKPLDVDLGQIGRVIIKYIEDNPDRVNITASSLILPALSEAYPCPSASQPEK